ncbi:squalene/phytoene synthase family protein [Streptomyces albus]|nr:squalene/phytoene synthase family protein [Streptomyces albus]
MTRLRLCLATALRYAVLEQVRNRLALALAVFFVPVWVGLAYTAMPTAPVRFFLRAADQDVTVAGNVLTQLSGAVHALALIVGFMMFLAARRSAAFDHRLVTAGYPRACLVLAKYLALLLACLLVAGYATAWICVFWRPEQPALLAAALGAGALTYGGAGIMLAALLRSELAGMFLVIMASFVDVSLQNPIANAGADSPVLRWLPTYGAMQSAVVAADTHHLPWAHLGLALLWALATAAVGTAAFTLHTRSRLGDLRRAWRLPPLRHRVYRQAGVDDAELRAGYETCRRLVRRSGQTDYAVTQLVPAPLRPLLWAIYGHGRVLDDLSDSGRADATERIDAWVRAMEEDLARGSSTDPVRRALTHAVTTWDLPTEQLPASFAIYRRDAAERPDFTSWEQWHAYWHALSFPVGVTRLATLLGEATGTRLGPRDAEALRRWTDAFNLVDALRDLRQDACLGRVALPSRSSPRTVCTSPTCARAAVRRNSTLWYGSWPSPRTAGWTTPPASPTATPPSLLPGAPSSGSSASHCGPWNAAVRSPAAAGAPAASGAPWSCTPVGCAPPGTGGGSARSSRRRRAHPSPCPSRPSPRPCRARARPNPAAAAPARRRGEAAGRAG